MATMVFTGADELVFDGQYGREVYRPYMGRGTPRTFVDDSCPVVAAFPSSFRPAAVSDGARRFAERCRLRSSFANGRTLSDVDVRPRDLDPEIFEQLREAVLERAHLHPEDPPTPEDAQHSAAHLCSGTLFDLTHACRHGRRIAEVAGDKQAVLFNAEHLNRHIDGAVDHLNRLVQHLSTHDSTSSDFAAEWQTLTKLLNAPTSGDAPASANGNGNKPKAYGEKSAGLDADFRRRHLERMRNRKMRQRPPYVKDVEMVPHRGGTATISQRAHDLILQSARANRGLETGGILFAASTASSRPHIHEATSAGPDAVSTPTSHQIDLDHDLAMIEDREARSLVEAGSWHTHRGGAAPSKQLNQPSDADLARWAMLRQAGRTYLGVILRTPIDVWDNSGPRIFAWRLHDSATGLGTIAEPVTLTLA
jgi:hypothetical protein